MTADQQSKKGMVTNMNQPAKSTGSKALPFVIGIPNMGVGLLWAMNMSLIPMLVGTVTSSNLQLSILVSMGAFTGIFVQYLAGVISDRSHFKMGKRKPFIIAGALIAALFICLMPFTKSYVFMFITAFLFYFSLNFYQGPYYSLIPEVVSDRQLGLANGFSKVVSVLGSAIIFLFGPTLWEQGHYLPFLLAALLGLLSVIVTVLLVKEDPDRATPSTKLSFDFVKNPSVMKLYLSVFFIFLGYGCITPFFVKYCTTALHMSESAASTGLLLLTIVGAAFAAPVGILSDKVERRKVLLMGATIFALSLIAACFVRSTTLIYIILSIIGIGFIAIQVTIYAILAEMVPPERMGEFMGIMNLFISLSQFIANNVMGILLDRVGFGVYFPVAAAAMIVATVTIFFSRFEKYKPGNLATAPTEADFQKK